MRRTYNINGSLSYFDRSSKSVSSSRTGGCYSEVPEYEVLADLAEAIKRHELLAEAIRDMRELLNDDSRYHTEDD